MGEFGLQMYLAYDDCYIKASERSNQLAEKFSSAEPLVVFKDVRCVTLGRDCCYCWELIRSVFWASGSTFIQVCVPLLFRYQNLWPECWIEWVKKFFLNCRLGKWHKSARVFCVFLFVNHFSPCKNWLVAALAYEDWPEGVRSPRTHS